MGSKMEKAEGILRLTSMVLATMTALLIGLSTQTKTVLFIEKKATAKDLQALWVATIVASVAAGYQLIQFCRCLALTWFSETPCQCTLLLAWISFLLDQGMTYLMFASIAAAVQASLIALTGLKVFQWTKLCNIYTRFCFEIGGGIVCGLVTLLPMVVISSISASRLSKLYPSYHQVYFSSLKPHQNAS
ncbi:hypothetical protein J5N97_002581 [Dioscorea zingiberensis]|uniref:CASP-like protein n=1 Tax=Dioscorea zingiberensis TaxID=325984 RepID=A0A9D5HPC4_9LILI|nr:hypothetical protein J5N97_002581 [Dioscorea zingiberensis]